MKFPFWPDFKGYRNIELGLSRVYDLLDRLGNPQNKLPPTIHIAGTNGKGSTLSFLRSIFKEAGYSPHVYTSPHLVHFNERFILNDKEIEDDFLNECLKTCELAANQSPKIDVTFFEGITVAAFLAFSQRKADILLLETGMGGRLDATNILPQVLCSIITPIAFDHTDFLGNSLKKIAFEKAGIIKENCPVMIGKQKKSALASIVTHASSIHSKPFILGQDWCTEKKKNGFTFKGFHQEMDLPRPSLLGDHQIDNAGLAIATALMQKEFKISENHIKSALSKTFWPARLQKITSGKFFNRLPNDCTLFLDGSHNIQSAKTIKTFLASQKRNIVIFAMLKDKDCEGFLEKIAKETDQLIVLEIENEPNSLKKEKLLEIANKFHIKAQSAKNFNDIFGNILPEITQKSDTVLICGSLYLAGNFLDMN